MEGALKDVKACYHCGEECQEDIEVNGKHFCCTGCQTVFEILHNEGLTDYYKISENPGLKRKSRKNYDYLENEELLEDLLDFSENGKSRITLFIPQIHCSSCIWLLENLSKIAPPVIESRVNYSKKEVSLLFESDTLSLKELIELLATLGYEPVIGKKEDSKKKQSYLNRELAAKIGVAGFCFGNIMLLSFPEYLDLSGDFTQNYSGYFGYLNLALSLPVLLYAARDYFKSAWKGLTGKFINIDVPIVVGILALFFKSSWEIIFQTGQGYFDSLAGLIFFLLIGKWYQSKSYDALSFDKDFSSYFPLTSLLVTPGGEEKNIVIDRIKKDDCLKIRNQEIIPADCLLLSDAAEIDYSFVTGESVPVLKKKNERLYAGGRLTGGNILVKTTKKVSQSYLTQLWQNKHEDTGSSPLNSVLDKVSRYFSMIILTIAILSAGYWWLKDGSKVIEAFISILIIACPCALALTVPFGLGGGMRVLGKNGLFLKNTMVIEKMVKINTVVFDKTGTLTESENFNVKQYGETFNEDEWIAVKSLVANSMHPYSKALYAFIVSKKTLPVQLFNETVGKGLEGSVNGKSLKIGSAEFVKGNQNKVNESQVHVSINGDYKGYFEIKKNLRAGMESLLKDLSKNYELFMISGDHPVDIPLLKACFEDEAKLHFNMSPTDKLKFIKNLQKAGKNALMVGDGLNDAGALLQSNVGIAVSEHTQGFSPACEAILLGNRLHFLGEYLRYAKRNFSVIKLCIGLSLLYNVGGLYFAIQALISPLFAAVLMPLSSVTVVLVASLGATMVWKPHRVK